MAESVECRVDSGRAECFRDGVVNSVAPVVFSVDEEVENVRLGAVERERGDWF